MTTEKDFNVDSHGDASIAHVSMEDLEKYGKHLKEWEELQKIEDEYHLATSDLQKTKESIQRLEDEIKLSHLRKQEKLLEHDTLYASARHFFETRQYEVAVEHCLKILEDNKDHLRAARLYKILQKKIEDVEAQRIQKERSLELNTAKAHELYVESRQYYSNHQFDKALQSVEEALSLNREHTQAMHLKEECISRLAEVDEELQRVKKISQDRLKKSNESLIVARQWVRENRFIDAMQVLEEALKEDIHNIPIKEELNRLESRWSDFKKEQEKNARLIQDDEKKQSVFIRSREAYFQKDWKNLVSLLSELDEKELDDTWQARLFEARDNINASLAKTHENELEALQYFNTGLEFLNQSKLSEALEAFKMAVMKHSDVSGISYKDAYHRVLELMISENSKKEKQREALLLKEEMRSDEEKCKRVLLGKIEVCKNERDWVSLKKFIHAYMEHDVLNDELHACLTMANECISIEEEQLKAEKKLLTEKMEKKSVLWFQCLEYEQNEEFDSAVHVLRQIMELDPLDTHMETVLLRVGKQKKLKERLKLLRHQLDQRIMSCQQTYDQLLKVKQECEMKILEQHYEDAMHLLEAQLTLSGREV